MVDIFRRVEKKYILSREQYQNIKKMMQEYVVPDEYGKSTICNIYFDTEDYAFIRHSITKPFFKEKVRLRSYNTPNKESTVFLEIKRKVDGVVGKRRIALTLSEFEQYRKNGKAVTNQNLQIKNELDYYFAKYNLKEKMYISYEREAFYEKDNPNFRITFDTNILARDYQLGLSKGSYGQSLLAPNQYIMEVKTLGAIPLWFVKVLDRCQVKPGSFSKYGEAYTELIFRENALEQRIS
ncbi:MAG: polyphosphate polymerase domain-containing protein [Clostridia bacterium]|nr:polyphosphate polymerase domain-containing protein [Clostridia bacterium]